MFGDSVWSYMLLMVVGMIVLSFVGQFLLNRIHEPYVEETEDGYIVYMYQTARRGGKYQDFTFTEKDGRLMYTPKTTRLMLYCGCMLLATVMVYHSFSTSGRAPGEIVKYLLIFGIMILGISLQGPITAYTVLRRDN